MARPAIYPWSKWFGQLAANGRARRLILKRRRDFKCQTHGMVNQIRNKAGQLGLRCRITVDNETIVVETSKP